MKEEVDEVISEKINETIAERDKICKEYIKLNYVAKEEAAKLKDTIITKDETIKNLNKTITEKDNLLKENKSDIHYLVTIHYINREEIKEILKKMEKQNTTYNLVKSNFK
ncbi:MAG: hypothetical protein FK730_09955 [Asgard group archaeon]|nr:hypothetical protein [Asgard group archaeon]